MSSDNLSQKKLLPERVNEISRNFWNSAILRAGIKLELFSLLENQSLSVKEISEKLQANSTFVAAFLETCVALELLELEQDKFQNSALASAFLIPEKKEYVGDLVLHITNHWQSWGKLDTLIREGRNELPFENNFVDTATYWTDYMKGQHNRAEAGQADCLVENINLEGKHKLLDLGGGQGSYSIALCAANPQLKAVLVDVKEPLEIASKLIAQQNLQERIILMEGDFQTVKLELDYDVVLISGVVCISSEEGFRKLLHRSYDALLPGGLVIIQDFMRIDRSQERTFLDTMMDLYLKIAFDPNASDRQGDEVASWLTDTGFINPKQIALPTHLALITAQKPTE
ncbi:MAG: methyltransferase domain-containing protein [Symploca sp. SIO2G7]|nr:methyltransferase domain-containing protein [Symploca sp. SIO2G7]